MLESQKSSSEDSEHIPLSFSLLLFNLKQIVTWWVYIPWLSFDLFLSWKQPHLVVFFIWMIFRVYTMYRMGVQYTISWGSAKNTTYTVRANFLATIKRVRNFQNDHIIGKFLQCQPCRLHVCRTNFVTILHFLLILDSNEGIEVRNINIFSVLFTPSATSKILWFATKISMTHTNWYIFFLGPVFALLVAHMLLRLEKFTIEFNDCMTARKLS